MGGKRWRFVWDLLFSIASYVIAFSIGVILANLIEGIPLDEKGDFTGSFSGFFTPYTILVGCTGVFLFMMHGISYLLMKTEGALYNKMRYLLTPILALFLVCYFLITALTLTGRPHMIEVMRTYPSLFSISFLGLIAIFLIPYFAKKGWNGRAFISSCAAIALLFALFGIGNFPYMIRSSLAEGSSLTFMNAASSEKTLKIILTIALIGVPLVIAYGFWIYRTFRGKVELDETSY